MRLHAAKSKDMPGIAASATCTTEIAARNNHHALILNCVSAVPAALTQAQIETDIASVTLAVKVRGGPNITLIDALTPAEILDLLMDFPGQAKATYTNAGALVIPFTRPRLFADIRALSLGMANIETYAVKVILTAGLATLSMMEVIPIVDEEATRPLGQHVRIAPQTRSDPGIIVESIDDLPFGEPGTGMLGYHIGLGTAPGVIGYIDCHMDDQRIYDELDAATNNYLLRDGRRTPNADYWHCALDLGGRALPVGSAKSFMQHINWTTAPGSVYRIIPEMIHSMQASNRLPG